MTTLDIFIKIFAHYSKKPETDLRQWIQTNISAKSLESLSEPISVDDAKALISEYKENPLEIIKTITTVFTVKDKPLQP